MRIKGKKVTIKDIPKKAARRLLHMPLDSYKDLRAAYYLRKISRKKHNADEPIRVAFIVQMPEIWDKEEPVYSVMKEDHRFFVTMIVVPPYDQVNKRVKTDYVNNYFLKNYPDAIRAYQNGGWMRIDNDYDYVFYPRPYDHYLPASLSSQKMIKTAKCAYIPYGLPGAYVFDKGNTNRSFFRNISIVFADSEYMAARIRESYDAHRSKELHKVAYLGYPALAPYFDLEPTNEYRRILWTPRWSYAPTIGGSHFLEYKDTIISLKKQSPELKVTFRPHPLLFGEMVANSLMSERDVDIYLGLLAENGIVYDTGCPIYETLRDTDILITDYSSIIIQYFVTGRPIIYCDSDIELNELFERLTEGIYIVHSEEELLYTIRELSKGRDPLQEKRYKIIAELQNEHRNAAKDIKETIIRNYEKIE